jgi:glucan phosphoethanolaminetransferase (alkaline phosphatase superfamily)
MLVVGLTAAVASSALALYRWPLMRLALHLLLLLCVPIELFYRIVYGGSLSSGVLLSITVTNFKETGELLAGHALVTLLVGAIAALALYSTATSWNADNPFTLKRCVGAGVGAVLLLVGAIAIQYVQAGDPSGLRDLLKDRLKQTFPIDVAYSLQIAAFGFIGTHRQATALDHFSFTNVRAINPQRHGTPPEIYVVVIGEASRRANWSLFGYGRSTTPRLDAIKDELFVFDHMMANATITIFSVPLALTRATPATWNMARSEKSIIGLLRQGGFTVHWISNQDHFGRNENPVSAIALEADSASFPEDVRAGGGLVGYDSTLVARLRDTLSRTPHDGKVVVFLHMMGSHFRYRDRYPEDFGRFRGFDGAPRNLQNSKMQVVNEYDNSVYFTDFTVRQIDQLATCGCKSAVVFFSDHGERLFDGATGDGDLGHGFPTVSRQELEVPFFLWLSASYRAANPELVANLKANANAPAALHSLFETLVDLTGLDYDGRVTTTSLFSNKLQSIGNLDALNTWGHRVTVPIENVAVR